jgi:signal peptidase II
LRESSNAAEALAFSLTPVMGSCRQIALVGLGCSLTDLLAYGSILLLLDQSSKWIVRLRARALCCTRLLRIHLVTNKNPLYRSQSARTAMTIALIFAGVSAATLHSSGRWFQSRLSLIGLGLALGGAAGNLLDIWRLESVIDFVDFGWWPAFNLADVGIVGGLLLAFWQ